MLFNDHTLEFYCTSAASEIECTVMNNRQTFDTNVVTVRSEYVSLIQNLEMFGIPVD